MDIEESHNHPLELGYQEDCPACRLELQKVSEDLKMLMVLYASPRFTNTRQKLDKIAKSITTVKSALESLELEIRPGIWSDLAEDLERSSTQIAALLTNYPKRSRSFKRPLLEFVMSCYFDIYGIMPDASLKPDPDPKRYNYYSPNSPSTRFIWTVWPLARNLAVEELRDELDIYHPLNARNQKEIPEISNTSSRTIREIIKSWNGKSPLTTELFPYTGDISLWSDEGQK